MKKTLLLLFLMAAMAAGCSKVTLKQEQPTSPRESYEPLPR